MKSGAGLAPLNGPVDRPAAARAVGEARGATGEPFPRQPFSAAPAIPGYLLSVPLGHGSVATVWKAVHTRTGRQVAVRVFVDAAGVNWPFMKEEVERLVLLDRHPHVLTLLDADLGHVPPYAVTEYMEGGSLQQFVNPARRVGPVAVAHWLEEMARALAFAHGKGIIHADLKPANVLLDGHGHLRIADFGQVRVLSESRGTLSTLAYMAPEQAHRTEPRVSVASALQPDVRWDLYALGAIVYALLTGQPPHAESLEHALPLLPDVASRLDAYRAVAMAHSLRPLKAVQYRDPDLAAIVRKCLEPVPAHRYGTAQQIVDDLEHRKAHRLVSPLAHHPVHHVRTIVRRFPTVALVAAGVLLLAATGWWVRAATRHADLIRSLRLRATTMTRLGHDGEAATAWAELNRLTPSMGARANALDALRRLPMPLARLAQGDDVIAIAYNPAGTLLVTGSKDGQARLWDAATGRTVGPPLQHRGWVTAVAFSPDGVRVITGSLDHTARIWDAATGQPVGAVLQHNDGVTSVAFSPDSRHVATGSADHLVGVWDAVTGKRVSPLRRHLNRVVGVVFNRDGERVAAASWDGTGQVWSARRAERLGSPLTHAGRVNVIAFSPDGSKVVTGSWDRTARIWRSATGQPVGAVLHHADRVLCAAWSPDGRFVATGSADNTARVWNAATGVAVGAACQHPDQVLAVAFSPDGRWIATGSRDGMARLWEASTGDPAGTCRHDGWVTALAFSPDGRRLAVAAGAERAARIWDVSAIAPRLRRIESAVWGECARVSADHAVAVIGDFQGSLHVFAAATGIERRTIDAHPGGIQILAVGPDGARAATAGYDHRVRFWDIATGREIGQPRVAEAAVMVMAFSPSGRWVVTGGADHAARVWDARTGQPVGEPLRHAADVVAAAFSPDERWIVTGSRDATARVWDVASGRSPVPALIHHGAILAVAFSPDGTRIATASADATARLWATATGLPVGPVMEHPGGVGAVAFSPSGARLATGGADKVVRIWDTASGKRVGPELPQSQTVESLCWSGSGAYLAAGEYGDLVRIWAVPEGLEVGAPLRVRSDVVWLQFGAGDRTLFAAGRGLSQIQAWATPHLATQPPAQDVVREAMLRTGIRINRLGLPEPLIPASLSREAAPAPGRFARDGG